jgi:hypothetical protein
MCTSTRVFSPEHPTPGQPLFEIITVACPMIDNCHHDLSKCPLKQQGKYDESTWLAVADAAPGEPPKN